MMPPSFLIDLTTDVVADASIIINLSATDRYETIAQALPQKLVVVDVVEQELESGRASGRTDADALHALKAAGLATVVGLKDPALEHFWTLVAGSAAQTLDDGEAATVAYAAESGAAALVDERKANRICEQRFPSVYRGATVDILSHPAVIEALGSNEHREAVFNALYHGKMRVLPHHQKWVMDIVGPDRASHCKCLPWHLRRNNERS